ncbi:MAG: CHAT domain-containing protein [Calditrichaeota bacterium]|nr:CHAT domain-containing protein [Calditrichota bacterium]
MYSSWVDFNEDGWLDLFVCNGYNQRNILYKNLGNGTFRDVTDSLGLVDYYWNNFSHWIDFDGDGDLDLFLDTKNEKCQIFLNMNFKRFINITDSFELVLKGKLVWADFNNDNFLDFYEIRCDANPEQKNSPANRLFKKLKNGKFVEIAAIANVAEEYDSESAQWININNDSQPDLFVININKQPDFLYLNNGNETFTNIFDSSGIMDSEGRANWADFNNDGWIDVLISEKNKIAIYKNLGDNTFLNITSTAGLKSCPGSYGYCDWIDFNNDGFLDLHWQINISGNDTTMTMIYMNNGNETFTSLSEELGFAKVAIRNYNSAWGDYDNDGDLDLYLTNKERNILYRNEGNENNWLEIDLVSTRSNSDAFGARVKVVSGAISQYKDVGMGCEYRPWTRQNIHFGLGKNTLVDSVIVYWPFGTIQDTSNIPVNQKIRLQEPYGLLFSDVSKKAGINKFSIKSYGVTFTDFDFDGLADIFVCNHPPSSLPASANNSFYKNMGFGKFKEFTKTMGLEYNWAGSAAGFGDFNNDGFGDLYIANPINTPNLLLQNTGSGNFLNITKLAGVAGLGISSNDLALADFDNNGYLDIYVGNNGPNVLYLNKGNFKFIDVTDKAGVGDTLISLCTAGDYDNDGDLDIYVANNRGGMDEYPIKDKWPNRLYRNNGKGIFTDVAQAAGVQDFGNSKGCCFGDYDNDGDLDLYVGNDAGENSLFQNNGDGTFSNVTEKAGVAEPLGTHAVVFADFDNDGYLDIYAAGGSYIPEKHKYSVNKDHPDALYRNNGDGTFTDISASAGIAGNLALTVSLATADFDNDGDLDVFLSNSLHRNPQLIKNVLLKNNTSDKHWVHFKLTGRKSNTFAIGTRVKLISGDLIQMREVSGGHGFGSQNSLPVEFGLGDRNSVDLAIIRWSSGIVQKLKNIAIDQMNYVEEPVQLGPLQLSAVAFYRVKIGFFSIVGLGLLIVFIVFLFVPAMKNFSELRRQKHLETARKVTLTLSKSDVGNLALAGDVAAENSFAVPSLFIKINMIKFRGEHLLTHLVESVNCESEIKNIFADRIEEKTPYPIKEIKIQRLLQRIEKLWLNYANYIGTGDLTGSKPIDQLKEIGALIYQYFGLTGLLNKLFSVKQSENLHLNIILDNLLIPWHWAFNSSQQMFLCEKFPYSVSFTQEKINFSPGRENSAQQATGRDVAVIFYGDWKGHFKELQQVKKEVQEIEQLLKNNRFQVYSIYQNCDEFARIVNNLNNQGENLRLIHYSGHIENNMLDLGKEEFIAANFLKQTYGIDLISKPVVFLNGCRSGEISNLWRRHDSLATEFLELGAATCIVTDFQIPEISAKNFAVKFYHYFIGEKLTAAQSLQHARLDSGKSDFSAEMDPEYDMIRYFYNLYGNGASLLNC